MLNERLLTARIDFLIRHTLCPTAAIAGGPYVKDQRLVPLLQVKSPVAHRKFAHRVLDRIDAFVRLPTA